jgi:glutamate-5-semialdehyde dehydrogenase
MTTQEILTEAKAARLALATADSAKKVQALEAMASSLVQDMDGILQANARDMAAAQGSITEVMLDRLRLDAGRIEAMAQGILQVAKLPDPVGRVLSSLQRPNGMTIQRVSVPMGVVAIIYESRPNVTSDAAALALQSGNVCVLRCGRESWGSCHAIVQALRKGLQAVGLPETVVNLIEDTSHDSATALMTANGYVDLLVPRGGAGLIRACVENATVPCIQTGTGICHVYVDKDADQNKALNIIENAKTSRPSVCNAQEVCLVHQAVAAEFLPRLQERLVTKRAQAGLVPVQLRLDEAAQAIIPGVPAGAQDFDTEFLDYILAVAVVPDVQGAIDHIAAHSTGHSEAIVTENAEAAERFVSAVDSAAVYVNVSTRFTDGGEFGLGCEMGISTQKLHARGPMGLEELCSYKYIIRGDGQVR